MRRKLAALEDKGWIRQNPDGTYCMVTADGQTTARRDVTDIDRRALHRVAGLFADLEDMVAAHDPAPKARARQRDPGSSDRWRRASSE